MSKRTLNFDNFLQEKNAETVYVTVGGKEYPVKAEIPAIVPVMLSRAGEGDVNSGENTLLLLKAGDVLFGRQAMNEIAANLNAEQLGMLLMKTFSLINGESVDGDDEEELDDESGMTQTGNKAKK